MRGRRTSSASAIVALLVLCARPPATAADLVWSRVDTPNFVVIGTGNDRSLTEAGLQFEGFREALSRLVSPTATATAVPTIVIIFPTDKSFEPFRPVYKGKRVDLTGLFLARQDVNYVLLGPARSGDSWPLVFHEYSHLIVNNIVPNLPPWLDEGLAEYYSSFEIGQNGRQVTLGKPVGSHFRTLATEPWLSIPDLVATTHESAQYNEGSRRSVFYAESWLLTHMLMHGEPNRTAKLAAYVDAITAKMTPQAAWAHAFAGDDIGGALRRYAERPLVARQYTLSEQIARASGVRVALTPAAAESTFGELSLAIGDKHGAAERFKRALALDRGSARAALGAAAAGGQAPPSLTLTASDDWLADYMSAAALVHASVRLRGAAASAVRVLEQAALRHPVPNMFGLISEASDDEAMLSAADIEGLKHAHASAPARDDYALELARALAMSGQYAPARSVLGNLIGHPHWPRSRENAMRMMRWVVDREQRATDATAAASAEKDPPPTVEPADPTSTTDPAPAPTEPARPLRPLYRVVGKEEQRAEGLLERVDCGPGKPAIVTVRYADRVARYQAPRLTDIEFITYQSKTAGRFSCGPRVPPDHIYLTWKPANGVERVVAIEFLSDR